MKDVTNIEVNCHGNRGDGRDSYSLSWHHDNARYHVWLDMPNYQPRQVVYKRPLDSKPGDPVRRLQLRTKKNDDMVAWCLRYAMAQDLFQKAVIAYNVAEAEREAKRIAGVVEHEHAELEALVRRYPDKARAILAEVVS